MDVDTERRNPGHLLRRQVGHERTADACRKATPEIREDVWIDEEHHQRELDREREQDREREDDGAVKGAAQQRIAIRRTIDGNYPKQQRQPEWNATGEEFEYRRGGAEQRDSHRERALGRTRHAAVIGVSEESREHEIGQAERKIDSKQPEATEQQ